MWGSWDLCSLLLPVSGLLCEIRICLFLRVWIWWVVICKEYGILREFVVFCFLGLFTRTLRPGGGLVVCGDGLLIVFNQVGMVWSLLRLLYTLTRYPPIFGIYLQGIIELSPELLY